MRAYEAFNPCEIDVFVTADVPGLQPHATTRAALLFALSDAAFHGGSMALQFTYACNSGALPPDVVAVAESLQVELARAKRGTITPSEARVCLRLAGRGNQALARALELSKRGFFSPERVAYLVTSGTWPVREAEMILLASPFPDLLLGNSPDAESRHMHAQAQAHERSAVLARHFDRGKARYRGRV